MVLIRNNAHQHLYNYPEVPSGPILLLPFSNQTLTLSKQVTHKKMLIIVQRLDIESADAMVIRIRILVLFGKS